MIEIMIVISITLLMSGTLIAYNRSSEQQLVLFRDQAILVGALNRAKSLSIERFYDNSRVCAFGLYFSKVNQNFVIFQDLHPTSSDAVFACRNDDGTFNSNLFYDFGEEVERFSIDSRLGLELKSGGSDLTSLTIIFVPPEISVRADASLPVTILLRDKNNFSRSVSITVGRAGQIGVY